MKLNIKRLYILLATVFGGYFTSQAQVVYSCDFEDGTENGNWVLNPTYQPPADPDANYRNLKNLWFIGEAGNFSVSGSNGLFISPRNDGVNATYEAVSQVVLSYRELTLPAGQYDIYFDYRVQGKVIGSDALYMCWIPTSALNSSYQTYSGATQYPKWMRSYQLGDSLAHQTAWTSTKRSFKVNASQTTGRLTFVWVSAAGSVMPPSACVDNIEIVPHEDCTVPKNIDFKFDGENVTLSWTGTADSYNLRAYNQYKNIWYEYTDIVGNSISINDIEEGPYTFFLRAWCSETSRSEYVTVNKFISIAANHCVNYLDLTDKNCAIGTYSNDYTGPTEIGVPSYGKVDNGYWDTSKKTRHTIHYDHNERDPYTGMKTIPDDEVASVRIGDMESGGEYAQVEYEYQVEAGASDILDFKYAIVLEDGGTGHTDDIQPRFTLEVFDGKKLIGCASEDFNTNDHSDTRHPWQFACVGSATYGDGCYYEIYYKDWTTVSISLRDYVGKKLSIRLRAFGCAYTAHFGYAYFTIGCSQGSFGDYLCREPKQTFTAPDNFDYRWYSILADGSEQLESTEQTFSTKGPRDTTTYYCDVISRLKDGCYYTLMASAKPRYPEVKVTAERDNASCGNRYYFNASSCVYTLNQITGDTVHVEDVETMTWDFGDGTTFDGFNPPMPHIYPDDGGEFIYKVRVTMNNNTCDSIFIDTIQVPSLEIGRDTDYVAICRTGRDGKSNLPYNWYGVDVYNEQQEVQPVMLKDIYGCDSSLLYLDIDIYDAAIPVERYDTICVGQSLTLYGEELTESGIYEIYVPMDNLPCDTLYKEHLYIDERLTLSYSDTLVACADDNVLTIPYLVETGRYTGVVIEFEDEEYEFEVGEEVVLPLSGELRPDFYSARLWFLTPLCEQDTFTFTIQANYSSSIVAQKDGFMALLNQDYNGGYKFTGYQWYRNGVAIEGATESYYRTDDAIDTGAEFTVALVREGDNILLPTCPLIYKDPATGLDNLSAESIYPTQVERGGKVYLGGYQGRVELFDMLGRKLQTVVGASEVTVPDVAGLYILRTDKGAIKISVK